MDEASKHTEHTGILRAAGSRTRLQVKDNIYKPSQTWPMKWTTFLLVKIDMGHELINTQVQNPLILYATGRARARDRVRVRARDMDVIQCRTNHSTDTITELGVV